MDELPPEIEIARINVRPGDVLVLRSDEFMSLAHAEDLRLIAQERFGCNVVVLGPGLWLHGVVNVSDEAPAIVPGGTGGQVTKLAEAQRCAAVEEGR